MIFDVILIIVALVALAIKIAETIGIYIERRNIWKGKL